MGGVSDKDSVAVYGAGKFGKQLYNYVQKFKHNVLWFDRNAEYYRNQGLRVDGLEKICKTKFDKILVAVLDTDMVTEIVKKLLRLGVVRKKICCLDINYITEEQTLVRILK